jgi:hypothetical protein
MRLLMILIRNRDREGWTQMTDDAVLQVRFEAAGWRQTSDGVALRPKQLQWARARLRHFGLSTDETFDLVPAREQPQILVEAWRRRIIGQRRGRDYEVPEHVAQRLSLAPGWGGARPGAGGARPGAGRPRSECPAAPRQRKRKKSRRKELLALLAEVERFDYRASFAQLDVELLRDAAEVRRTTRARRHPVRDLDVLDVLDVPATFRIPTEYPSPLSEIVVPRFKLDPPEERLAAREVPVVLEQPFGEQLPVQYERISSWSLTEDEIPPPPTNAPVARTPIAQRFAASMKPHECEKLLAATWRGAWRARYGATGESKAAAMLRSTGDKSAKARRAAVEALRENDIAPASWCAWVLDFFARVCPDEPPPAAWVALSPAMINKHAMRCRGDIVTGNQVRVPFATYELRARWEKVSEGLRVCKSREEALELIARTLPKWLYRQLWQQAAEEVELFHQDYAAKMARGEWIWG